MATAQLPDISEIKRRMAQTNQLFNDEVFVHRNFDALDQIYTTDARILPPGAPMVSGRTGIKKFWSDLVQSAHAIGAELSDACGGWRSRNWPRRAHCCASRTRRSQHGSEVRGLLARRRWPVEMAR